MPEPIRDWDIPSLIVIYRDESTPSLNAEDVAVYLKQTLGVPAKAKGDFLRISGGGDMEALARRIAETKVRDLSKPFEYAEPAYGEIQFELKLLEEPTKKVPGVLYDGGRMLRLFRELLPAKESAFGVHHLIFTSRLVGSFEQDGRYHAHVDMCGYPSIISTSGIVEAPAKPRDYYVLKRRFMEAGEDVPFELLKEQFSGQFIDYDDPRMTEVMKGYALQCILYLITKEPFCDNRDCRLFDAHWQAEVIRSQLGGRNLCTWHEKVVDEIRKMRTHP